MAIKKIKPRLLFLFALIILSCGYYLTLGYYNKAEKKPALPIVLAEKGLLEDQYWRPVISTLTLPLRPQLSAEKLGFLVNFCLSVDFTIKSDGNIAELKIVKTSPAGVIKEVTITDLKNMLKWQFVPTAENALRQPVVSNRVFNFKVNHRGTEANCYSN